MADQKLMKKRLKVLMAQPHNQVCIDCPEKKPTWASLIVPPPGAPQGTQKMGAFVCLECSGSHRRLGVHIAFVRSVNLDAWKEWEVEAMENGGNAKINAIFEAKLAQSGRQKLTNLDNGPTRERYIRDKYERRKFYDPAAFSQDFSSVAAAAASGGGGVAGGGGGGRAGQSRPGAPSEIARQRVASRQARMKPAQSNVVDSYSSSSSAAATQKVAQAPVSAPVTFDLLDFGSEPVTSAPTPAAAVPAAPSSAGTDLFGGDPFASPAAPPPPAPAAPAAAPPKLNAPPATSSTAAPTGTSTLAQELMSNPSPAKASTSNDSIMALFGPPKQQAPQSFGMQAMANMGPGGNMNNNNSNMMAMMGGGGGGMQQGMAAMTPQQQQQKMMMMSMNNMNNGGVAGGMGGGGMMMAPGGMMSPQMQQQMMMAQQMQRQQQMQMQQNQFNQQQQGGGGGGGGMMGNMNNPAMMNTMMGSMNNNNNSTAMPNSMNMNNNFNAAMMGMQNMSMGGVPNGGGIQQTTSGDDGGFGAPMGGNASNNNNTNANDPFNSLGGMNAFR